MHKAWRVFLNSLRMRNLENKEDADPGKYFFCFSPSTPMVNGFDVAMR